MSDRTAVYRLYDTGGALLYIGIAASFGRRWTQHAAQKTWWPEVQRQTVDWYPDRQAAGRAEVEAIRAERPKHNIVHTPRQIPTRKRRSEPRELGIYMGSAEIGRMLGGISRQRVQQLIARDDFPEPEVVLDMGKVWKRDDVLAWARAKGRINGE